jgi:hypothetical protein
MSWSWGSRICLLYQSGVLDVVIFFSFLFEMDGMECPIAHQDSSHAVVPTDAAYPAVDGPIWIAVFNIRTPHASKLQMQVAVESQPPRVYVLNSDGCSRDRSQA